MRKSFSHHIVLLSIRAVVLTIGLLCMPINLHADDMKESKYYTMETHTDYLYFSVLLTDLNKKNTWAKDGYIKAVCGSQTLKLVTVYTKEMSSDYNENYNVFANNELKGGIAFLSNANGGEKELEYSNRQYWVWKGADNDRTYAKISYYYPPELAGKTWTFYYTYKHNNNSWYNMKLGSAYCSPTMGLKGIDANDFTIERSDVRKMEVTLPALPDDVPTKLKDNRKHVGKYSFTFSYLLYDGSTLMQKESFDCETSTEKTCVITIPKEAANFKSVNMSVDVQDALYCIGSGTYFWNTNSNISKSNLFPSVPQPESFGAEYLQFDNKIDLAWQAYHDYGNGYQYIEATSPYVYRMETDRNGQMLSGEKWTRLITQSEIGKNQEQTYDDNSVEPNKYYKYLILNIPKAWAGEGIINDKELETPSEETIQMLGHVESNVVSTFPEMSIYDFSQDLSVEDKVVLKWKYSRVPVKSKTVRFQLKRRLVGTDNWSDLDQVQGDATPTAGTELTYSDNSIASNRVRYEYKLELSINDGANVFESDVITAGVIAGSTVTALDATKGQHTNLVRVTWKVKQVGTDNTNFELYRRYLNSGNEFMKIHSTSGTSDNYTYEDNTAQPGYYYEYKIEAYSGDKDSYDDTSYQNALSAIGFCQSTGVISGRVTFGTAGTSVGDVRLTLRASDTGEGGDMQQYTQRVNGSSTGIVWEADSAETVKLFGSDKNYSIQMFVRPDEGLTNGSVISEVPGLGRLLLGAHSTKNYPLIMEQYGKSTLEKQSYNTIRTFCSILYREGISSAYSDRNLHEHVYPYSDWVNYEDNFLVNSEGYTRGDTYDIPLSQNGENYTVKLVVYYKDEPLDHEHATETLSYQGTQYDTGLTVADNTFSLLTLLKDDETIHVSVNGETSNQYVQTFVKSYSTVIHQADLNDIADAEVVQGMLCRFDNHLVDDTKTMLLTYGDGNIFTDNSETTTSKQDFYKPFSVGGSAGISEEEAFRGNLCEVRVWDHMLTEAECTNTNDRILSGNETGLKLYWPMSEGIDRLVVDASFSNDVPNGRHATVGTNIKSSTIVPSDHMLSRYAITNGNGEYTLRGIPFLGSGTTYTLTPTKSIHVFSPTSRNGFVSGGSLTLNNYDFTDQSSFTVRGKVTYKDTNIPADSVMFKIDGTLAQKDNKHVLTDANGEYEISVPIGNHTIEAYKEGHVFSRFPADGSTYGFYQEEVVNFYDSTLVNVTGRINGGFTDSDAPLGFRLSTNRLGKATLKLSLGKESQCSFNYRVDKTGNGEFGTTPIPVESATANIHSTAYRAGGSHDDTYYIYITTDSLTGEFSALLPPLRYMVNSITFDGGNDYDNEPVFKDNLPVIDATTTIPEQMQCDSLDLENENLQYYYYSGKLIRQLRTTPTITVTQNDMENGAFGVRSLSVRDDVTLETTDVPVVQFTDTGYKYLYGHPIFVQGEPYEFTIKVREQYTNLDTRSVFMEVPQDAVVNISNEASTSAATIVAQASREGEQELHPGDVYDVDNLEVTFDEAGTVGYGWIAGFPSLSEGYIRNLSISVSVDGRTTMWKAPDSRTDALDMVISGGITTGNNFVTGAPDQIDMILRRPPGSTAYAQWSSDTAYVWTKTISATSSRSRGGGVDITVCPSIEFEIGSPVCFNKSKERVIFYDTNVRRINAYDDIEIEKQMNSYSVSTTMKTPSGMKRIQNNGDTYIGRATNLLFGKGRFVGLIKQADGSYQLGDKTTLCTSTSFKTSFVLPQEYIEEELIPNWTAIIENHLTWVPALTDEYCKKVEGEVRYYTTLKKGDYGYGSANSDENVWNEEQYLAADGHPSYRMIDGIAHSATEEVTDSVEWANQQINKWREAIGMNEKDKVTAFEQESTYLIGNFSIAGGTMVSQSTKVNIVNTEDVFHTKTSWNVTNDCRIGATFNDAGVVGVLNFVNGGVKDTLVNVSHSITESTLWQISDASPATALSVDVFRSPGGYSPIFRTRGGQTCNPYEGATLTKYYKKGTELDKATMRIENPKLSVIGSAELSDVPTGTSAEFKLLLSNESETNNTCTYILEVMENSNPDGAVITMDGQALGNGRTGRSIRLGGNESIIKTLLVSQSNRSVIDYEDIRLVLRSEEDVTTSSDPVVLKVHFIPSSAIVDISVDHTVLNSELYEKNKGVIVTLSNLNRQDNGLKGVRIQYRKKGLDTWSLAKEWKVNPETSQEEAIPDGNSFSAPVSFYEDGIYELRGQTFGSYGPDEVTYSTAIIEVTQDILGPKILGIPYPEIGMLYYDSRNEMHVRFNESINTNALSKSDNFRIVGNLNNSVLEEKLPDVAVLLNDDEISTQSTIHVDNSDFAIEGWFYRQGDGTILGLGTEDNSLSMMTNDNGKISLRTGGKEQIIETDAVLPKNTWNYIALSYHFKRTDDEQNLLSALFVNVDMDEPLFIVKDQPVDMVLGSGNLNVGGNGMKGMMRNLALWNSRKSVLQMYQELGELKANHTPGLVGYWSMDEGHGTTIVDKIRSRNIVMPTESWYINNRNLATHLEGERELEVDISSFAPRPTDNYAIEFWFRSDNTNDYYTLMDLGNHMALKVINNRLTLTKTKYVEAGVIEEGVELSDDNHAFSQWHHIAMNVRRGANVIFYLDGEPIKTVPESEMPPAANYISFGFNFLGDMDDIRIWNAALTGNLIADRRFERLDSTYAGLVGYFPMESIQRNESGTVTTTYDLSNFGDTKSAALSIANAEYFSQAPNAPALIPGSQRLRFNESEFSFIASENEIYFQFPDNMLARMDDNEFTVTVSNVKDLHGNNSEPIEWKFNTDFSLVNWATDYHQEIIYDRKEPMVFTEQLENFTSSSQTYEILNLPTWITVDKPINVITGTMENIRFTLLPSAPIGTHTIYIYVSDCHGIKRGIHYTITVIGEEPDWQFSTSQYESSMALVGQLYVADKICENPRSMIAAFDELGTCRGVAHPEYMRTRDAYYLNMYVYGNPGTAYNKLTFKLYDASTGITYPTVKLAIPDSAFVDELMFASDALYGNYDTPVIFRATEDVQQLIDLSRDWSWVSIFVKPLSTAIADVLPKQVSTLTNFKNIKSQTAFSSVDSNGNIIGEVTDILPGAMYKIQTSRSLSFNVLGSPINVVDTAQTIHSGYNWIGTLSTENMSPSEAFADLNPKKNDMIKNRSQVALYRGDGIWEGTLKSIVPGEGYIYFSGDTLDKQFHYPKLGTQTVSHAPYYHSPSHIMMAPPVHYTTVDPYLFPDNMNVIAVVEKDGQRLNNAEVAAFINGECRGAICANEGSDYYFLTVMGSSADDMNRTVELRVFAEGTEYVVDTQNTFINDNILGNLDEPYVLDLDAASGIRSLYSEDLDDEGWYTLQGYKLEKRPSIRGVYIHKGVKVVIE